MSMPSPRINGGLAVPPFLLPIEAELRQVEDMLYAELSSPVQTAAGVSTHVLDAGGKRLRPALIILAAHASCGKFDPDRLIGVAASSELIHMASLVHDDVIDEAESRRGRMTANSYWGNQISVLTGDYMLAKAVSILARDGDIGIMRALSQAVVAMTEGEIHQMEAQGKPTIPADMYFSIIRGKTAALISACCRIGAILASASPEMEDLLAGYGLSLGLAFQITDDLLDLIGDPARTGKPVGGDIREGRITLPLILAMERADPADRVALERILSSEDASREDVDLARRLAEETGAIDAAREAAADYIRQAMEHLVALPASEAKESLNAFAQYILVRKS
jgi:octaprenyl-diphosphate synthase